MPSVSHATQLCRVNRPLEKCAPYRVVRLKRVDSIVLSNIRDSKDLITLILFQMHLSHLCKRFGEHLYIVYSTTWRLN